MILLNATIIFLLQCILHFVYNIIPCFITSIFTPVNESIFEHLKLIFTSSLLFSIIIKDKKYTNYFFRGILTIAILLTIYLPVRYFFGENIIITLIILFISILFSEYLIKKICIVNNKKASIILVILFYIFFGIATYFPPKTFMFYDTSNNIYGIKK